MNPKIEHTSIHSLAQNTRDKDRMGNFRETVTMSTVRRYLQQQEEGAVNIPFLLQQIRSDFVELILLCNLGKKESTSVNLVYREQRVQHTKHT